MNGETEHLTLNPSPQSGDGNRYKLVCACGAALIQIEPGSGSSYGTYGCPACTAHASAAQAPCPKVGVTAVIRDAVGRILLGKKGRACSPELVGKWVTPGGRVNFGETLEGAIIREVYEETKLSVRIAGVLMPQQLILERSHFVFVVFECQLSSHCLAAAGIPGDDLADLRWCHFAEVDVLVQDLSPLTIQILNSLRFSMRL